MPLEPSRPRLLLIGPLPANVGGDSAKFDNLLRTLQRRGDCEIRVIDTSRDLEGRWLRNPLTAVRLMATLITLIGRADVVVLFASDRGMAVLGPLVTLAGRAWGRPTYITLFGGSFDRYYLRRSRSRRWLLDRTVLSASGCLFETRHLVRFFTRRGVPRVRWYANHTEREVPPARAERSCHRFVFLGRIGQPKGIHVLLESAPLLPEGLTVDVFGPASASMQQEIGRRGLGRVRYGGILTRDEVNQVLWDYDALVLPTTHESEGYPGVILEAFAHGLPVIATRWMSIPELVTARCGVLIPPRNAQALVDAMVQLHGDPALHRTLSEGARDRSRLLTNEIWAGRFLRICGQAGNRQPVHSRHGRDTVEAGL